MDICEQCERPATAVAVTEYPTVTYATNVCDSCAVWTLEFWDDDLAVVSSRAVRDGVQFTAHPENRSAVLTVQALPTVCHQCGLHSPTPYLIGGEPACLACAYEPAELNCQACNHSWVANRVTFPECPNCGDE